ncbi:MAG: ATP-binding protein [Halioglobus sp.]
MNSIRVYLAVMLVAAFILISFLAALNGYLSSMKEAESLLDSQLEYASDILLQTFDVRDADEVVAREGAQFAFQVWVKGSLALHSPGAPKVHINELTPGYRFANFGGYRWRTLTRVDEDGIVYIVGEREDLRYRVAEKVVLESVLPLLLWLPVSALLVWVLVGWGLRPLRNLSREINSKASDDLSPLGQENPPRELEQLVESTNALLARLSAAFEREKHFASHAAHELRTPLSVLKVHLHNLAEDLPADHSDLAHANAGLARMHHLVEQILDLNRTNPELIKARFEPVELHKLAQQVTARAWPEFSTREQTLSLQGEPAYILGDPVMLETLLTNLLENAKKYTPEGGEILVHAYPDDNRVALIVEDSGPGIEESERARVFERFYRSEQEFSGANGSGLGLAIVQHIAQVHGASIALGESSLGGLRVMIEFPATEAIR